MRQDKLSRSCILLYALGLIPVVWLSLLIAPAFGGGVPSLIKNLSDVFSRPFHFVWCDDSLKTVLILVFAYVMGIGIYISSARNYRHREEHGSAKWGSASAVNKKYRNKISVAEILTEKITR